MTTTSATQGRFDLIPTQLAITAMRDNGYKNAAYALAELIDNGIQAGASVVEILCAERDERVVARMRRRVDQIGVLDNGSGMNAETLRIALQFGNGTHLHDRSGMGRFGMGLPNASVSQCRKVEVWTWQSGIKNAIYSLIDLDEVERGRMQDVPEPRHKSVPAHWIAAASNPPEPHGTLVVWSNLDRCTWMTAKAVIDNSEFLVGRMYRRFITKGAAFIRFTAFTNENPNEVTIEKYAQANDPLYRTTPSGTPEPFSDRPMFVPYGDEYWEHRLKIAYRGGEHEVTTRFTIATEEARHRTPTGQAAGNLPHGRHAKRNVGISIVRADRELELDQSWVNQYDPRERWWGVEVDFPPALDEVFGVTNNKQSARNFSELADLDIEEMLGEGQTPTQLREQLADEGDPRVSLIELAERIRANLSQMRNLIAAQASRDTSGRRRRHAGNTAEVRATTATRQSQDEGHEGQSDRDEGRPKVELQEELEQEIEAVGLTPKQAHDLAHRTVEDGLKFVFVEAPIDTPAFFSVKPRGGAIIVTLNTEHPVHTHLVEVLEREGGDDETADRLSNAAEGLKLLLAAWARYEDEQREGPRRDAAMDARSDWGRVARRFFSV